MAGAVQSPLAAARGRLHLIRLAFEEALAAGIAIDAIGLQTHMHQGYRGDDEILAIVDRFARFGLPLQLTETAFVSGHLMPPEIGELNDYRVAALTAVSYARLSVRYRSAGGTVTFVDRAFGVGELTGSLNVVLWAGCIVTTALSASAFGSYAATLLPGGSQNPPTVRLLIVAGIAGLHITAAVVDGGRSRRGAAIGAGALGCVASLVIVIVRSALVDAASLWVLAGLVARLWSPSTPC